MEQLKISIAILDISHEKCVLIFFFKKSTKEYNEVVNAFHFKSDFSKLGSFSKCEIDFVWKFFFNV